MGNYIQLSSENKKFLEDNYKTMTIESMAKTIGHHPKLVKDRLKEFGLARTKEDRNYIASIKRKPDHDMMSLLSSKIEGGTTSTTASYHLRKWNKLNGKFDRSKILVYKNSVENFSDLALISKEKYHKFISDRNKAIATEKKTKAKALVNDIARKKRILAEEREKQFDEIKKNTVNKSVMESNYQLVDEDRVPVKHDAKTTVWVKKSKCEQLEDGSWIKKTPLNITIPVVLKVRMKRNGEK